MELIDNADSYICSKCGYKSKYMMAYCPNCGETVPYTTEELEKLWNKFMIKGSKSYEEGYKDGYIKGKDEKEQEHYDFLFNQLPELLRKANLRGYNNAIDDFYSKLKEAEYNVTGFGVQGVESDDIDRIAEELKRGGV